VEPSDDIEGNQAGLDLDDLRFEALRYRNTPGRLRALIEAILDDESRLTSIAEGSAFHPNGFVKIVLGPGRIPRLRLHVWPRDRPVRMSNPHGHRWPFASWIITGTLREVVFVPAPHGERFAVYDYHGTDGSLPDRPSGSASLARLPPQPRRAGTVYTRTSGELHIADPATDDLVASLVLQGADARPSTPVYRRPGQSEPRPGAPISPGELRGMLKEISGVLEPV
jgi:hypothetical protein